MNIECVVINVLALRALSRRFIQSACVVGLHLFMHEVNCNVFNASIRLSYNTSAGRLMKNYRSMPKQINLRYGIQSINPSYSIKRLSIVQRICCKMLAVVCLCKFAISYSIESKLEKRNIITIRSSNGKAKFST